MSSLFWKPGWRAAPIWGLSFSWQRKEQWQNLTMPLKVSARAWLMSLLLTFNWPKQVTCPSLTSTGRDRSIPVPQEAWPATGGQWAIRDDNLIYHNSSSLVFYLPTSISCALHFISSRWNIFISSFIAIIKQFSVLCLCLVLEVKNPWTALYIAVTKQIFFIAESKRV